MKTLLKTTLAVASLSLGLAFFAAADQNTEPTLPKEKPADLIQRIRTNFANITVCSGWSEEKKKDVDYTNSNHPDDHGRSVVCLGNGGVNCFTPKLAAINRDLALLEPTGKDQINTKDRIAEQFANVKEKADSVREYCANKKTFGSAAVGALFNQINTASASGEGAALDYKKLLASGAAPSPNTTEPASPSRKTGPGKTHKKSGQKFN